ncbi:MAG: DUF1508 domain-containing protein, partial [Lysobacterales bacterium]
MKVNRIEIFRAGNGGFMWHAVARNGKLLAWSGETYKRRADCVRAMEAVTAATE